MLKTKIIKILPVWGIGLGLVIILLASGAIFENSKNPGTALAQAEEIVPQVLGAAIDLRGQQVATATAPTLKNSFDDSHVSAKSYLVADVASGSVITEKNSHDQQLVASLTKLMTALLAYQNVDLNSTVTLTPNDVFSINPVLGLRSGDKVKLLDLFNAMLVGSNNDAALALANHVESLSGQNFIKMMNDEALTLGMDNSHFSNPLGFDSPGNYSTADDILKLVSATQKFSAFTSLSKLTGYSFTGELGRLYKSKATDTLVADHDDIQAIKTGFTQGAGQAMITKATQDGHAVYIIVLDSRDREADTLELKNQIFENTDFMVK